MDDIKSIENEIESLRMEMKNERKKYEDKIKVLIIKWNKAKIQLHQQNN